MKKMSRLFTVIALVFCMTLSALPLSVSADTDSSSQIVSTGGKSVNEDGVEISKTVLPTDRENYFDIVLTATTKETNKISISKQETDVVIVMDISNTMNYKYGTSHVPGGNDTRIHSAQEAAKAFTDKYCSYNTSNGYNGKLAVVTFNTNADTVIPLTEATMSVKNKLNSKIDDIAPNGKISYNSKSVDDYAVSGDRFTNIEAGLKLAENILEKSKAANKTIVLLTDGFPTTYVKSNGNSATKISGYNPYTPSGKYGTDGVFYDAMTKRHCTYGTNYSDKAAYKAQNVAANLKKHGINIFSIGIDIGSQSITKYIESAAGKNFSTVDCYSDETRALLKLSDYVIGSGKNSYVNWLGNVIGGGNAFDGMISYADGSGSKTLEDAFDKIYSSIVSAYEKSNNNDLTVTDPMGPEIEFLGWGSESDGNEKVYTKSTDTINWNLMKSNCETVTDGDTTTYTYTLTYKVRLENEIQGFDDEKSHDTNGRTTLKYRIDETGKQPVSKTVDFSIPSVKGFLADLTFEKSGSDGKHLKGAVFELKHDDDCCNLSIAKKQSVSGENGEVKFTDIPSGHRYILKEVSSVDGYFISDTEKKYTVDVSYGVISISDGEKDVSKDFAVINERKAPASVKLAAKKLLDGKAPGEKTFYFELVTGSGDVLETVKNDENGNVTFSELSFDEAGTYNYVIREKDTGDFGIIYDKSEYGITVTVSEGRESYDAVVTCDKDEIVFSNTTETPTVVIEDEIPKGPADPIPEGIAPPVSITVVDDTPLSVAHTLDENSLSAAFLTVGISAISIGMILKKKKSF